MWKSQSDTFTASPSHWNEVDQSEQLSVEQVFFLLAWLPSPSALKCWSEVRSLSSQDWETETEAVDTWPNRRRLCNSAPVSCRSDLTVYTHKLCQYTQSHELFEWVWQSLQPVDVLCSARRFSRAVHVCRVCWGHVPPHADWGLLTLGLWPAKELPTKHPASSSSAANYRSTNTPPRVWYDHKT